MSAASEFSPHPQWIDSLHGYVKPYWDELLQGEWAEGVASTRLSISEMRGWILQIYPFIHAFPKFLAEALIKVEDDESRSFLIEIFASKKHTRSIGSGWVRASDWTKRTCLLWPRATVRCCAMCSR